MPYIGHCPMLILIDVTNKSVEFQAVMFNYQPVIIKQVVLNFVEVVLLYNDTGLAKL